MAPWDCPLAIVLLVLVPFFGATSKRIEPRGDAAFEALGRVFMNHMILGSAVRGGGKLIEGFLGLL